MDRNAEIWWENHLDEYIATLSSYVVFPSIAEPGRDGLPFGKPCFEMLSFLKAEMDNAGLEAEILSSAFAMGVLKGSKREKKIGIVCHGDVVPVSSGWEQDPFTLFQKEDHLVGRGTTDNKGAGIAVLFALRYLIESGFRPESDIVLLFGSAEEIGMKDYPLASSFIPKLDITLVPDSGFPVAYGEKGSLKVSFPISLPENFLRLAGGGGSSVPGKAEALLKKDTDVSGLSSEVKVINTENGILVTALGKERHPATPDGGEDAITKLIKALVDGKVIGGNELSLLPGLFSDFYGTELGIARKDEESGRLTAVLTQVETVGRNAVFTLNIRLPFNTSVKEIIALLKTRLKGVEVLSSSDGFKTPLDNNLLALNDIANEEYGSARTPYVMAGGTYARVFPHAVAYGMGSPLENIKPPFPEGQGRAHQTNESVHIERMKKGFSIYAKALRYLDENL